MEEVVQQSWSSARAMIFKVQILDQNRFELHLKLRK